VYDDSTEELQNKTTDDDDTDDKREHKRLKHWGKKNRKLRDKTPYGDEHGTSSFIATIRNRVSNSHASIAHQYRKQVDK
jgi:hypothetical protein